MITKKRHLPYLKAPHIDLVMRELSADHDYTKIKSLMKFMQKWRIPITQEHYTYLVVNCARKGDIQRASSHIYSMKKENPSFEVTAEMYSGHIAFWASKGKLRRAKNIINGNKQKGIHPVSQNYVELISHYQQSGAPEEEITALRKEMVDEGFSDAVLDKEE